MHKACAMFTRPDIIKKEIHMTYDKQSTPPFRQPKENGKESFSHKVGDKIERTGEKLERAGAEKLGRAVSNAGDKIEHMKDKK